MPMQEREPLSFAALYEEYFKKIYRYAYRSFLHRETAEDVTEEIFLAVFNNLHKYDAGRGSLSAWIGAIARNRIMNHCKKAHMRYEIVTDDMPEQILPEEEKDTLKDPQSLRLWKILSRLPVEERSLLELRFELDLDYGEIAGLLGITKEAARKRCDRLLEKCRRIDGKAAK